MAHRRYAGLKKACTKMCLPLFFCPPPRRAGQHHPGFPVPAPPRQSAPSNTRPGSPYPAPPRLFLSCTAPAFPLLRRLRLSCACHQARAPALISAQFYFFDPPLLFPPGPRGSEKTPSYLPNFCALEPAKLNVRARSTYRARASAGAYRRV